ncbi:MAG: hypothetical protein ACE366_10990 [Bradymonadia bacterium]
MAGSLGPDPKAHRRFLEQTGRQQRSDQRTAQSPKHLLGLDVVEQADDGTLCLEGKIANTPVRLRRWPETKESGVLSHWPWRIEAAPPALPSTLQVVRPNLLDRSFVGRFSGPALLGDDAFDEALRVSGISPMQTYSIMSHNIRRQLLRLLQLKGGVENGVVFCRPHEPTKRLPRHFKILARNLAGLSQRMVLSETQAFTALLRNAVHDPAIGFRTRALEVLLNVDQGKFAPAVRQALAAGVHSDHDTLKKVAGEALNAAFEQQIVTLDDADEAVLLALLDGQPSGTRDLIITRLTEIGTQRAVPALVAIERSFFKSRRQKDAARAAIEAITQRTGAIKAGGLTVVEDSGPGQLSLIPAPEAPVDLKLDER